MIANLKEKKIVDQKTLRDVLEKRGTDLAPKLFDKATEQGAQKAFDVLMVGLAAAVGGPAAGGAAAIKAFGDSLIK